jgi:Bacterial Ig-like domain (group 3)
MLSGTAGATGTYHISFTASNGVGSNAVQSFTLTVIGKLAKFSTTTMLASTPNPSILGEGIVFTAIVSSSGGTPPDGELITFYKGATSLGTAPLSGGTASVTVSSLLVGASVVVAHYSGDSSYSASSSVSLKQVVDKYPTSVQFGSSLNPAAYGQSILFTAAVGSSGPNTPTGTVTFKNGTTNLKTVSLVGGVATLTSTDLAAGTLSLTAVYNGDAVSAGSTSPTLFQVVNQATTTTTLVSSLNPSSQGKSVKFSVSVESPTVTPTGTVTLTAGTTVLSTVKLAGGKASFATTTLPPGSVTITAAYNGTANIEGSSGTTVQEVD